jgi:hypothetical protein
MSICLIFHMINVDIPYSYRFQPFKIAYFKNIRIGAGMVIVLASEIIISALYWSSALSWIVVVRDHRNNSPRVYMTFHLDTLFRFRVNQSLLFLLNAAYLAEKQPVLNCKFVMGVM